MSYIGKKNGNPNTDFLEAGGELENHDLVNVDSSGRIITPTVNRTSTNGDIAVFAKDGTTVGSIGCNSGGMYIGSGDTGVTTEATLDAIIPTGNGAYRNNAIDLGYPTYAFKDLYLGGGVYLGGTTSANYLDDYEEGTFTPAIQGATTNPTYTGEDPGYYVKIGKVVHFLWYSTLLTFSSVGSGTLKITLPFTVASNYNPISTAHNTIISGGAHTGFTVVGTSYLVLQSSSYTTGTVTCASLQNGYIMISGTYHTS